MSNLEPEQVKQAESAPSSPENAPESPEKKEESALYYTKWQQRMMKKGYVVTPKVKKPAKQNAMEWIATLVGALLLVLHSWVRPWWWTATACIRRCTTAKS